MNHTEHPSSSDPERRLRDLALQSRNHRHKAITDTLTARKNAGYFSHHPMNAALLAQLRQLEPSAEDWRNAQIACDHENVTAAYDFI